MNKTLTTEGLAAFLKAANKETYANRNTAKVASLRPGSEDYHFKQDDLEYHDTYFGSKEFIGSEIVYKQNSPVWGMNYYGYILDPVVSEGEVYNFLREVLLQEYEDVLPVRGPYSYAKNVWVYVNTPKGTLDRFVGAETISLSGEVVYQCDYHGGLVV